MTSKHDRTASTGAKATVAAAGAVVWRGKHLQPEVALVHRPAYDDWSFPKGKLDAGEHAIAAAIREVGEETGSQVRLGTPLPTQRYSVREGTKTVLYWAAEHISGSFTPDDEIDALRWLSLDKARSRLTHEADRHLLTAFVGTPLDTLPSIALRHAKALSRSSWHAPDQGRPLTARGDHQAEQLAAVLAAAFAPLHVVTSPWLRCVQTVEPYAAATSGTLELLDALGEDEFSDSPALALDDITRVVTHHPSVLLCSHGNVTSALVDALSGRRRKVLTQISDAPLSKGEIVIVHRREQRAVSAERHCF